MIYTPREDSYLLMNEAKEYSLLYKGGRFLDMCAGSGIIGEAMKENAYELLFADIDNEAVNHIKRRGFNAIRSDLFSRVKGRFDIIVCNPPYLPESKIKTKEDLAICGGKKGNEIIIRFLKEAKRHLKITGTILLLFSNLSGKKEIDNAILRYGYEKRQVAEKSIFFEKLYVYEIKRKQEIPLKGKEYFARGKRGLVYLSRLKGRTIVVKEKNPKSRTNTLLNEAKFLEELNEHNIGPKLIAFDREKVVMQYVNGVVLPDYLEASSLQQIKKVLKDVFNQCFVMDKLHITKFELTNPYKHVIVLRGKAVQIDFERCRRTNKPKNVTQFCQYITSRRTLSLLKEKGIIIDKDKMLNLARMYKKNYSESIFKKIHSMLN